MNLQPTLKNDKVELRPLREEDFEAMYAVASDPMVWAQHPNKNRYRREVFEKFFEGAIASGGAFLILDSVSGEVAGSSRFYDYDAQENSIFIGYTFFGRKFWGKGFNTEAKKLMLEYIFQYVEVVKFHVGKENLRSCRAMEKLGAMYVKEITVAYYGEPDRENVEYHIYKDQWCS